MKILLFFFLSFLFLICATGGAAQKEATGKGKLSLNFNQVEYLHRWSRNDLHEFTPAGQEDLSRWTDMLSLNVYQNVRDGEGLALVANQVLETYKAQKGMVLKTSSVPRTSEKPAEHFIAVVFGRPTFLEAVHARFKLDRGKGVSVIHSHRVYGKAAGPQMSGWLKDHGPAIEKVLLAWELPPSLENLLKSSVSKSQPRQ